jgi:hypothetical protein
VSEAADGHEGGVDHSHVGVQDLRKLDDCEVVFPPISRTRTRGGGSLPCDCPRACVCWEGCRNMQLGVGVTTPCVCVERV